MSIAASIRHLQTLIMSFHPVIVIETVEEERVEVLLNKAVNDLQMAMFDWSIAQGLVRSQGNIHARWTNEYAPPGTIRPSALENTTEPLDMLKHIQDMSFKAIYLLKDFAKHLDDAAVARQFREIAHQFSLNRSAIVITGDAITLPRDIAHDVVYFPLKLPDQDELYQVISEVTRSLQGRIKVQLQKQDVPPLVRALQGMTLKQAKKVIAYAALEDGALSTQDIGRILQRKAQVIHEEGLLDYISVENNTALLGGFSGLKQWLARAKVGFSPQAQAFNLQPPKGILIVGIQGCGKSLAAKTIAREWKMPLLKLDAGRLYNKYVGESERNFRRAVSLAESMAPAVLWIDEIEKSMGVSDTDADGGLSRRLFGYFLTWLQEKSQEVFVVATANDLSRIPPELLRKGRFDEIFFVDLPDPQERAIILKIHLQARNQSLEHFDLTELVQATDGFSGAEIEQAVITALYRAIYEQQPLDTPMLVTEIKATTPLSISRREDLHQLRAIAQGRFVNVK
ncbi:MAG: AAA family ATPase [Leptolyngbyaceae cyanobacterium MO_188.B28]|nr:AAA family ATPase [Leptolyngbyaceae cyanobacterium MO_188.B28]